MAMKLYFQKYDERCYTLEYHRQYMIENNLKELQLFEAKRETGSDYFYCKHYQEIGEVGEGCGKLCDSYRPLNGKNGRCSHYGYVYEQTDQLLILSEKF